MSQGRGSASGIWNGVSGASGCDGDGGVRGPRLRRGSGRHG